MIRAAYPTLRRWGGALAMAVAASPLLGCSGASLVNALTPTGGYSVRPDLAYGTQPRQRLDLYVPDGAPADAPLLVFFYGGNWQSGSKDIYRFVGQAFASRGYVTAIPDYRVYPEARYPDFLADGAAAIAWLRDDPGIGDGRRLFLAGHSAGAYIAAMLALDRRWLGEAGCGPVTAAAGLAGPYDFLPLTDPTLIEIFGPAGPQTQPVHHVAPGDPPMLLATGTADTTVRPRNSVVLAERLQVVGVPAQVVEYQGVGHVGIVAALAAPLRFLAPVLDDVDGFLRSQPACRAG